MNLENVEKIARAVLYEGYLLYPYRRSALKNQFRWNFGVLYPEDFSAAVARAEPSSMQTECLVKAGPEAIINVRVRFLHLEREPFPETGEAAEHATERVVTGVKGSIVELAAKPQAFLFRFPASKGVHDAEKRSSQGTAAIQEAIEGTVDIAAARVDEEIFKLTIRVSNRTPLRAAVQREAALMRSLVSTHMILHAIHGEFISLIDPPQEHRTAADACRNLGAWPVLVGDDGEKDCVLAAPIILYDYPQIAPESAGDLFDATEIDELLTLRILTLTEEEKEEMRGGDSRAREILERSEALPAEQWMKLHGALRGLKKP